MFNRIKFLLFHLARPVVDLKLALIGLRNYPRYLYDLWNYHRVEQDLVVPWLDLQPQLHDRTPITPIDYPYFYQQLWAFKNVLSDQPRKHLDIGSTHELSAYLAHFVPTTFLDLRPVKVVVPNLTTVTGDLLNLPFADNSQKSVSCLHVIEHIGLGRYGDKLNPKGLKSAADELTRVLAPDGKLYLSLPVGRERVCFNAHRILLPATVPDLFTSLKLLKFALVDDEGQFHTEAEPQNFSSLGYGCGMFLFTKEKP